MKYTLSDDIQYATEVIDAHINNFLRLNIQDCAKYINRISKDPTQMDLVDILNEKFSQEQKLKYGLYDGYEIWSDPLKILDSDEFKFNSDNLSFESIGDYMIDPKKYVRFKVIAALLDNYVEPKFDLYLFDKAFLELIDIDANDTSLLLQEKKLCSILNNIKECFERIKYGQKDSEIYYNPICENISLFEKLKKYINTLREKLPKTKNKKKFIDISELILIAEMYGLLLYERCLSNPYYYIGNIYDYNYLQYEISFQNAKLFWLMEQFYNSRDYRDKITEQQVYDEFDEYYTKYEQPKKYSKDRYIPKIINGEYRKYFVYQTCKYYRRWCCKKYENIPGDSPVINKDYVSKLKAFEDKHLNYSTKRNSTAQENELTAKVKLRTAKSDIYNPLLLSYKLRALQQGFVLSHCDLLLSIADYDKLHDEKKYIEEQIASLKNLESYSSTRYVRKKRAQEITALEAKLESLKLSKLSIIEQTYIQNSDPLKITEDWWNTCPFAFKNPHFNKEIYPLRSQFCKKKSLLFGEGNCECLYKIPLEKDLSATEIAYILGFPTKNVNGKRSNEVIRIERLLKKKQHGYAIQDIPNSLHHRWGIEIFNLLNTSEDQKQTLYNYNSPKHYEHTPFDPIQLTNDAGFILNNYGLSMMRKSLSLAIDKHGGLDKIFSKNKFFKFERYHLKKLYEALNNKNLHTYIWLKVPFLKLLQAINYKDTLFKPDHEVPDFPIFSKDEDDLMQDLL